MTRRSESEAGEGGLGRCKPADGDCTPDGEAPGRVGAAEGRAPSETHGDGDGSAAAARMCARIFSLLRAPEP
jgi:hypothetical protein